MKSGLNLSVSGLGYSLIHWDQTWIIFLLLIKLMNNMLNGHINEQNVKGFRFELLIIKPEPNLWFSTIHHS